MSTRWLLDVIMVISLYISKLRKFIIISTENRFDDFRSFLLINRHIYVCYIIFSYNRTTFFIYNFYYDENNSIFLPSNLLYRTNLYVYVYTLYIFIIFTWGYWANTRTHMRPMYLCMCATCAYEFAMSSWKGEQIKTFSTCRQMNHDNKIKISRAKI